MTSMQNEPSYRTYLKGAKVVDADTHITEWPDLWTSRAPAKYKDRVPQKKTRDGVTAWMIDDHEISRDYAHSAIRKDGSKVPGLDFFNLKFDEVFEGAHNLKARLAWLDDSGIAAQIGYTNLLGFGGGKSMKVDAALREIAIQIQNDAMAELQADSKNRIYPMAMIPWWDVKAAVKETERCAAMGLRGINTHATPHEHGLPDLGHEHWAPLWEVCEDKRLPVNFHVGFSQGTTGWESPGVWPSLSGYEKYAVSGSMLFTGNMLVILNLLMSTVFKRHQKLKFVSVESGLGWIPFMLEQLQYQVDENLPGGKLPGGSTVVEMFRQHFSVCCWYERDGLLEAVRRLGAGNILFETDFPHPTCLYPGPLEYQTSTMQALAPSDRVKVFGGNAEALYNLDLSAAPAL